MRMLSRRRRCSSDDARGPSDKVTARRSGAARGNAPLGGHRRLRRAPRDLAAGRVEDGGVERDGRGLRLAVAQLRADRDGRPRVAHGRGRHVRPPVVHVHGARGVDPHVAVEARARVPARRAGRVVQADRQLIRLARHHVGRQVDAPGGVAVRPAAHDVTVEPDRGVRHGPVDVQEDGSAPGRRGNVEPPAIPAHTRAGQPAHASERPGRQERPFDGPVVRQVYPLPGAVVEIALDVGDVAAPVAGGPGVAVRGILDERIAGGQDPLFDHGPGGRGHVGRDSRLGVCRSVIPALTYFRADVVLQTDGIPRRIPLVEAPADVDGGALSRRSPDGGCNLATCRRRRRLLRSQGAATEGAQEKRGSCCTESHRAPGRGVEARPAACGGRRACSPS